jgi:hypothetical protein
VLVLVDGCRHRDNEDIACAQVFNVGAALQILGGLQFLSLRFQRKVVPDLKLVNALWVDIKTNDRPLLAKFNCKWKANIAQADDGYFDILKLHFYEGCFG